jgi:hypothetical protein
MGLPFSEWADTESLDATGSAPLRWWGLVTYMLETKEPVHLAAAFRSRRWHFGLKIKAAGQLI